MKNNYLPKLLSFFVFLLIFTACEKEAIQAPAAKVVPLSPEQSAIIYLNNTKTPVPFIVLEIDHTTNEGKGFLIDKKLNLKEITAKGISYLRFDEPFLAEYFMDNWQEGSVTREHLDPVELAKYVKMADNLKAMDPITTGTEGEPVNYT